MRSTATSNVEESSLDFPKLMIGRTSNTIVLMSRAGVGTVVGKTRSSFDIGDCSSDWVTSDFKDYNGVVELSN